MVVLVLSMNFNTVFAGSVEEEINKCFVIDKENFVSNDYYYAFEECWSGEDGFELPLTEEGEPLLSFEASQIATHYAMIDARANSRTCIAKMIKKMEDKPNLIEESVSCGQLLESEYQIYLLSMCEAANYAVPYERLLNIDILSYRSICEDAVGKEINEFRDILDPIINQKKLMGSTNRFISHFQILNQVLHSTQNLFSDIIGGYKSFLSQVNRLRK